MTLISESRCFPHADMMICTSVKILSLVKFWKMSLVAVTNSLVSMTFSSMLEAKISLLIIA